MKNNQLTNAEKFKELTIENKTKLISVLKEVTGRKEMTIKQRWLWDDAVPDKYRNLVTKGLNKVYNTQIKKENQLENELEKLLN